jgi:hypothetical protein
MVEQARRYAIYVAAVLYFVASSASGGHPIVAVGFPLVLFAYLAYEGRPEVWWVVLTVMGSLPFGLLAIRGASSKAVSAREIAGNVIGFGSLPCLAIGLVSMLIGLALVLRQRDSTTGQHLSAFGAALAVYYSSVWSVISWFELHGSLGASAP